MTEYKFLDKGLKWLDNGTIMLAIHGSRAYGTNTPSSDYDIRGICVPTLEYFLGFNKKFEQAENCIELLVPSAPPLKSMMFVQPDTTIFDIRKFFKLAADCNPNIVELLFLEDSDILRTSIQYQMIRDKKEMFLSKKAKHTFSGYAHSQLKRIGTHRRWLLNPPERAPERVDYGLPERTVIPKDQLQAAQADIQKQLDTWEWKDLDDMDRSLIMKAINTFSEVAAEIKLAMSQDERFIAAGRKLGYDDNFLDLLERERRYGAAKREWEQFNTWKKERNKDRAELEKKYGYDCKHAMHLVRLLRQAEEILDTHNLTVKRPDAEELKAIRNGAWPYEQLMEWTEAQEKKIDTLYETSTLRHKPDINAIDQLCQNIVQLTHKI